MTVGWVKELDPLIFNRSEQKSDYISLEPLGRLEPSFVCILCVDIFFINKPWVWQERIKKNSMCALMPVMSHAHAFEKQIHHKPLRGLKWCHNFSWPAQMSALAKPSSLKGCLGHRVGPGADLRNLLYHCWVFLSLSIFFALNKCVFIQD